LQNREYIATSRATGCDHRHKLQINRYFFLKFDEFNLILNMFLPIYSALASELSNIARDGLPRPGARIPANYALLNSIQIIGGLSDQLAFRISRCYADPASTRWRP
jgi:hypothetical protein